MPNRLPALKHVTIYSKKQNIVVEYMFKNCHFLKSPFARKPYSRIKEDLLKVW